MNGVAKRGARAITDYDPEKGLQTIVVAEAAEKHWARAKDPEKLYEAIEAKLEGQREYILWRDGMVVPSRKSGGRISVQQSGLPESDPGHVVAHRWRKKLKDLADYRRALLDAQMRCLRICEQQKMGTVRGTEGTGEFELFTPAAYVALVREVLNEIDLDPASNEQAQATIRGKCRADASRR